MTKKPEMQYGIQSIGKTPEQEALLEIAALGNDVFTSHKELHKRAVKIASETLLNYCNIDVGYIENAI